MANSEHVPQTFSLRAELHLQLQHADREGVNIECESYSPHISRYCSDTLYCWWHC